MAASAEDAWRIFALDELLERMRERGKPYYEFLRVPTLSCGVYILPAGSKDLQAPHDEDEVYFVVDGRARLRVGQEERRVERGSVLYVRATEEHSFIEIDEDMTLLVFFASGGPEAPEEEP